MTKWLEEIISTCKNAHPSLPGLISYLGVMMIIGHIFRETQKRTLVIDSYCFLSVRLLMNSGMT
jgi:hypothetical protein